MAYRYTFNSYRQYKRKRRYRYIDGGKIGQKSPAGYCWCERHRGYLSKKHIADHKCNKRKCSFFERFAQNPKPKSDDPAQGKIGPEPASEEAAV